VGYNVKDDESKERILADLQRLCRFVVIRRHVQKFDSATHVPLLCRAPHVVTIRSNGNPYILFLTRNLNTPTCFFVDKKVQQGYHLPRIILANMWFSSSAFEGSAFEGEMIKNKDGSWQFAISDVLLYARRHLVDVPFPARYDLLRTVLSDYKHDPALPFTVSLKPYWQVRDMSTSVLTQSTLGDWPHTCRGLLFKPACMRFKDILLNFDDSQVVKNTRDKVGGHFCESLERAASSSPLPSGISPSDDSSEDLSALDINKTTATLWARKGAQPDQYELFTDEACVLRADPPLACMPCLATSKMMAVAFRTKTVVDRVRVECVMSTKFGKWEPVRLLTSVAGG
jgi:hypothetical protein